MHYTILGRNVELEDFQDAIDDEAKPYVDLELEDGTYIDMSEISQEFGYDEPGDLYDRMRSEGWRTEEDEKEFHEVIDRHLERLS